MAVEHTAVLLIAYDASYPEPLRSVRPIPDAFGVALLLAPSRGRGLASRSLGAGARPAPTRWRSAELERLRRSIPAARSLPLLAHLARGERGRVVIDYLDGTRLAVEVSPCR